MTNTVTAIRAVIDGRPVTREEILAWETERLPRAAAKIGLPVPTGDPARQRRAFTEAKLALGAAEIRRRLARDLRAAAVVSRATTRASFGRRAVSVCDLHVTGGSATEFTHWFNDTARDDYESSMIAANPDHYLIRTDPQGRQEVIETTGGSPLATRYLVDYEDTSLLATARDTAFPIQLAGVARTDTGTAIGGVRHEFRDEPGGFHAHLLVEFPRLVAPHMLSRHRWHLACEFSHWIEFAFA